MPTLVRDQLFAPLDADLHLERIAGGNETEVYCSDDRRFVVKVKCEEHGTAAESLLRATSRRQAAHRFTAVLGATYSIPNYFILASDNTGQVQSIAIQPYIGDAVALFAVEYANLTFYERQRIARHLLQIIGRSVRTFLLHGWMPDLYGRSSVNRAARKSAKAWWRLPERLWSFLVKRNLLRAHNLLLTAAPERRILLVDYDAVPHGPLYQFIYYNVRLWLFLRDLLLIAIMVLWGYVPRA
jgi:hypothetical protein